MLTKEQILQADDLPTETIPVPEWGGDVIVKTLKASELDRWEQETTNSKGRDRVIENVRARLVAKCIVDEQGNRLFDKSEVVLLGKKSAKVLDRLFDICMKLNGKRDEDIEELEKNLETIPTDVSNTD